MVPATLGRNAWSQFPESLHGQGKRSHRNVRSYTTVDAQLRYDLAPFGTGLLQNTLVELNAVNVFNVGPPFLNNQVAALGYDQENADPDGRLLSLQVRKTW
jgi:outer membrane receptor protein involved in Fe transport